MNTPEIVKQQIKKKKVVLSLHFISLVSTKGKQPKKKQTEK